MGKYDLMEEGLKAGIMRAERYMFKLCAWNLMNSGHESAEPHGYRSKGCRPGTA
jgi:hypothetical protein